MRNTAGSTRECVATKCIGEPRHGRAAQVSRVDHWISAADPTTVERSVQAFPDMARRNNPCSQALCLSQLQECLSILVKSQLDFLIVFERLVGDSETSGGELLGVQVACAVLLEREFRRNSGHTCCSPVVHVRIMPS